MANALVGAKPHEQRCLRDAAPDRCLGYTGEKQELIEREPPLLFVAVDRGRELRTRNGQLIRRWKDPSLVAFPQRLGFMRSGEYEFCGAILHHGATPLEGHYTAICRLGPNAYGHFDDRGVNRLAWAEVETMQDIARDVYIILYARCSVRCGDDPTGAARVPYVR
jgi:hypothetical protein